MTECTITKLELETTMLREQRSFYDSLGFSCTEIEDGTFEILMEYSTMRFVQSEAQQEAYHFCFLVSPTMFAECKIRLDSKNVKLIKYEGKELVHLKSWNSDSWYFFDAAGHIVEFIVHHSLEYGPQLDEKFIQIAEMGIVTEEIEDFTETVHKNTGLAPYSMKTTRFRDIGYPGTMFVVCNPKEKFTWYPSDLVPKPISCKGAIEKDGRAYDFEFDGRSIVFRD